MGISSCIKNERVRRNLRKDNMHLSEGVLHTPVLLGGAAVALVCVMIVLTTQFAAIAANGIVCRCLFCCGIPFMYRYGMVAYISPKRLAGLFLGWAVFPAF